MPDPLDALRTPITPLAPRRQFADELRRRLEAALRGPEPQGGHPMEQTLVRQTLTPYLIVADADAALGFYADVLGATQTYRLDMPDGRVGHSTMRIGGSEFHLADEYPELGIVGPNPEHRSPVGLTLQVDDPDDTVARAVARGATVERPVEDQFYGARAGTFRDPFGHVWTVQKHIRDVSDEELQRAVREQDQ